MPREPWSGIPSNLRITTTRPCRQRLGLFQATATLRVIKSLTFLRYVDPSSTCLHHTDRFNPNLTKYVSHPVA